MDEIADALDKMAEGFPCEGWLRDVIDSINYLDRINENLESIALSLEKIANK